MNSGKAIWWCVYPRRECKAGGAPLYRLRNCLSGLPPEHKGVAGVVHGELKGHGAYGYPKFDFWLVMCSYPCMMRGILGDEALMATQDLNSVRHVLVVPNRT